jgi:hypothetical protein
VTSYVKSYEATKPKQHPVGMNQGTGATDATRYANAADWVSPRTMLPPSNVTTRVLVNDTDHPGPLLSGKPGFAVLGSRAVLRSFRGVHGSGNVYL